MGPLNEWIGVCVHHYHHSQSAQGVSPQSFLLNGQFGAKLLTCFYNIELDITIICDAGN